jgi:uncharacterized membrane protein
MQVRNLLWLIGTAILILIPEAYASSQYYADLEMALDGSGFLTISGRTNFEGLSPGVYENFTSKKAGYWLLNISPEAEFSNYIISLQMPPNCEINYLRASSQVRIESSGDRISLTFSGGSEKPYLIVQYKLRPYSKNLLIPALILGLSIVASIFVYLAIIKKKGPGRNSNESNLKVEHVKPENPELNYKIKALPQRQAQILRILIREGGSATQARIMQELRIPKASVSRNIKALITKGLVHKERHGMTNMLFLKQEGQGKNEHS